MNELKNLHYVANNIYRSGIVTEGNFEVVKKLEIKSIISMKLNNNDNEIERKLAENAGIKYFNEPILLANITSYTKRQFYIVEHMLHKMTQPTLVHCTHGSDRTGIAIAMYRIWHCGFSYAEAIIEMEKYGFNPVFSYWKHFLQEIAHAKI